MKQISCFYKDYQILLYPMEPTLRDTDVYSHQVMILHTTNRNVVYERYFDTDNIFWSGVETQEKLLEYCTRVVDNLEGNE